MGLFRIALAVCVLLSHTHNITPFHLLSGDFAVEVFFVISGFYMQLVLSHRYSKTTLGKTWFLRFYASRYARLYPAYATVALATVLCCCLGLVSQPLTTWGQILSLDYSFGNNAAKLLLFLTNFTMLFQDAVMYMSVNAGQAHLTGDFRLSDFPVWQGLTSPQAWSLGIEITFYVIAPLLLNLRTRGLLAIALVGIILKIQILNRMHLSDPFTYRFFPFELPYFLAGAVVYRFRECLSLRFLPTTLRHFISCCLGTMIVLGLPIDLTSNHRVILAAFSLPIIFETTCKMWLDRAIGELSYPFYISHWLAIGVTRGWVNTHTALYVSFLFAIAILAMEQAFVEPWRERIAGTDKINPANSGNLRAMVAVTLRKITKKERSIPTQEVAAETEQMPHRYRYGPDAR